MNRFSKRIEDLEKRLAPCKPWVRIIQNIGETREQAIAKWEAENGQPFDHGGKGIIWRTIVAPKAEAAAHG